MPSAKEQFYIDNHMPKPKRAPKAPNTKQFFSVPSVREAARVTLRMRKP
jgi:hypothetical protein